VTLTIADTLITSDVTDARAELRPDATADRGRYGGNAWVVSWIPERLFDRNQAITAMTLAERVSAGAAEDWPFIEGWAAELGLSGADVVARISP
jgi:hypothetical protein